MTLLMAGCVWGAQPPTLTHLANLPGSLDAMISGLREHKSMSHPGEYSPAPLKQPHALSQGYGLPITGAEIVGPLKVGGDVLTNCADALYPGNHLRLHLKVQ